MKKIIGIIVVVLVVVGLFLAYKPVGRFGGTTNLDVLQVNTLQATTASTTGVGYFGQGIYEGGLDSLAPASTTINLAASDISTNSVVAIVASSSATTVNFPASSTLSSFLSTGGDSTWLIVQSASTTASTITFAGGTGTTLQTASSSKLIIGGDTATFRIYRKATGGDFNFALTSISR